MSSLTRPITYIIALLASLLIVGCSNSMVKDDPEYQSRIMALDEREAMLAQREAMLSGQQPQTKVAEKEIFLPPAAKPGECYARAWVPSSHRQVSKKVLVKEAGENIEIIPAKYSKVMESVVVNDASERLVVIPATYKWVEEKVVVVPGKKRVVEIPAVYENVTEQVIDKPAHTAWKKGTGPIQKIDEATGEIMCLVDIPATYRTVKKRVLISAGSTKVVETPPVYKTVKRRMVDIAATTRVVKIPAKSQQVEVVKEVAASSVKRTPIPAVYKTVTVSEMVKKGNMEWRSILCETNMTNARITDIQRALRDKGHNPGPIDGVIGPLTMNAVNSFQKEKALPVDKYLNIATLKALGVSWN